MKAVRIDRSPSAETGTFGRILLPWLDRAWPCLELPWADNEPQYSCIPAGTYRGRLEVSSKWSPRQDGRLYHLLDVPGRTLVKLHAATWAGDVRKGWHSDLLGCIAPGRHTGRLPPPEVDLLQPCVLQSRAALTEIMELLEGDDIEVTIAWDAGAEPQRSLA